MPPARQAHGLAGAHLAHQARADLIEGARLRGDAVAAFEPADHQRAHAVRVAEGDQLVLGERHGRERADQASADGDDRIEQRTGLTRQQRGDELGVGGRLQWLRVVADLLAQRVGVGQVAVVAEGHQAVAAVAGDRLRVLPLVGPRGRVADVTDRRMAGQAAQRRLVEHRADQAQVTLHHHVPVVGDRDAGAFLAAVLERVERKERQAGDVPARGDDAEHPALVVGRVVVPKVAHATALVSVAS